MSYVFADTFFFLAIINPRDAAHLRATELALLLDSPLLCTNWVIAEVGNGLSGTSHRRALRLLLEGFTGNRRNLLLPPTSGHFDAGVALYDARLDKAWSLTDCVIDEYEVQEALTADRHFEQAGFKALLADAEQ